MTTPPAPGARLRGVALGVLAVAALAVALLLAFRPGSPPPPPADPPRPAVPISETARPTVTGTLPPLGPAATSGDTPDRVAGAPSAGLLVAGAGSADGRLRIAPDRPLARVGGRVIKLADLVPGTAGDASEMTRAEYDQRLRRVIRERATVEAAQAAGLEPEKETAAQTERLRALSEARRSKMAELGAKWSSESDAALAQEAAHLASISLQQKLLKANGGPPPVPSAGDVLAHFKAHRERFPTAPAGAESGGEAFAPFAGAVRADLEAEYQTALEALLAGIEKKAGVEIFADGASAGP